ncbi:kinesin-like protein KIN-12E [Cornus florida]|uniref:kinesin-like protein KIN-12E n=1 Tax=Cornus florida TaxID=4283 RepID=UPI0028A0F3BF|nr:kinesin-like protein KIN-12E [Cornus florida]
MPFISEAASAIKSRFGFHERSLESMPSVRSSPDLLKSVTKEKNSSQYSTGRSVIGDVDEDHGMSNQGFEITEDPSFWKDHNVQVIIRVRPLSSSEISLQGYGKCVKQESSQTITWTGHPESRFTFDLVADENVSQEMLFKVAGVPMVENCMGGYNSCMFAYGQTGSGKTHTMLGDIEGGTRRHSVNCGMTPRVFESLFSSIQKEKEARREEKLRFTCKCSFLEIYNEQILDLLDPTSMNLQIREDAKKGVFVDNLTEVEVTSARDVIQQLVQGAANRKVAATNMNHASSRSHSVFTCIIESKWESQGVTHHRFARLNLVDLAGSERQKSSGAEGERLKEATNINKSLSTLGLVIMNLVNSSNGKSLHVPYRDSKLTFLLQDSLGGNAKTSIIANISPSSCCSLETLSTLKFAQRAKFIKNHAIVNEDASGDVLAMRMQIQQLKKEVSRLRSFLNGGAENHESDALTVSFPGSPGSFKWEGLHGSFSPFTSDKRMSQKKEYEVALVGAFRREKDKDIALQASAAESQAAMQLAKQREDEIQGLKMRLRFREAGIKRLEAVASGKISAETHLLKEKDEHLKEIEVLRTQVDRNQEVTRFAMENLRLKEEIRRLKSFCEEGERERMNEQIMTLQTKLLEALDWKLMHESDPFIKKGNSDLVMDMHSDCNLLVSGQESASPWRTSINEENEFLRMQAIQNQSEMDTIRKKLNLCLEEKDKLERQVNYLETELEAERSSKAMKEETHKLQIEPPSLTTDQALNISLNDQIELKTMVDAIAAASQREAEAHEIAIILSKENDELQMKLKVLIEDNNKLIELYEAAVGENNDQRNDRAQNSRVNTENYSSHLIKFAEEKVVEMRREAENLEHQLMEMHEENEKLMGLYEKAMQERDDFKRVLSSGGKNCTEIREFNCQEKLVEGDGGDKPNSDEAPVSVVGKLSKEETGLSGVYVQNERVGIQLENPAVSCVAKVQLEEGSSHHAEILEVNDSLQLDGPSISEEKRNSKENAFSRQNVQDREGSLLQTHAGYQLDVEDNVDTEARSLNLTTMKMLDDLNIVRMKLDRAQEKLLNSAPTISSFGSLEKAIIEVDKLSREIEAIEDNIQAKQQEYAALKLISSDMQGTIALIDKKMAAIKYSLSRFSSSVGYFEQREVQARARVHATSSYVDQKKEELARLQAQKDEIEDAKRRFQQSELELRNDLLCLKSKVEKENRRQEHEKVLFAIDNVVETDSPQINWHLGGKATELLKSEEEKTKLQTEMKQAQEKLGIMRSEVEDLNRKFGKVDSEMQVIHLEVQKGLRAMEENEQRLRSNIQEKEMVLEMKENGRLEFENIILEYHQCIFEAELKEEEMKMLEEELQMELRKINELQMEKAAATERKTQLLDATRCNSFFVSDQIEEELQNIQTSVQELKSLLADDGQ